MTMANKTRGEITLTLEGVEYVLRPTHEAVLSIEEQTGKGVRRLAELAMMGDLTTKDVATIVTECLRAQGRAVGDQAMSSFNAKRIHALLMEADGGFVEAMHSLSPMLVLATSGGYTSQGELRAPVKKTKAKATPTGA